jgi:hypothetical protein
MTFKDHRRFAAERQSALPEHTLKSSGFAVALLLPCRPLILQTNSSRGTAGKLPEPGTEASPGRLDCWTAADVVGLSCGGVVAALKSLHEERAGKITGR